MKGTPGGGAACASIIPHGRRGYARQFTRRSAIGMATLGRSHGVVATLSGATRPEPASSGVLRPPEGPRPAGVADARGEVVARSSAKAPEQYPVWRLTDVCLSVGLDPATAEDLERLLRHRVRFHRNDVLFRAGDRLAALYAIRLGCCKTVLSTQDGHHQIAGFHMSGDIVGTDGIGSDVHECDAIALEDLEAWRLPFDEIETLANESDRFRRNLHRLQALETARAHTLIVLLGGMRADKRLAVFLLEQSTQFMARGYSPREFLLRMTRAEIGSYLGLKLETVSRLFSRFQREGVIRVVGREVRLLDQQALHQLVDAG